MVNTLSTSPTNNIDAQGLPYILYASLGSQSSHYHTVRKEDFMKEM
jgi:hypothetical protein